MIDPEKPFLPPQGDSLFNPTNPKEPTMTDSPMAAGWYPTPDRTAERYFDGMRWSDSYRSPTPQGPPTLTTLKDTGSPTGIVTTGYALAILFPIVGFIMGLVIVGNSNKANSRHGGWIVLASIVAFVVWCAILVGIGGGGGDDYTYSTY